METKDILNIVGIFNKDIKVLVCGGRRYSDAVSINKHLTLIQNSVGIGKLCSGGAKGADLLAQLWAIENRIDHSVYYAKWNLSGKSAGTIRNHYMLKDFNPDLVVAFPGGIGTSHMVTISNKSNIPVLIIPKY